MTGLCGPACWTPTPCPTHHDSMPPFGRDNAGTACCDKYASLAANPDRHLWSEHDSTRWYTDLQGWDAHEANCTICGEAERVHVRLTREEIVGAQAVRTAQGWLLVERVHAKSVTVHTGYSWVDPIGFDAVLEVLK